MSHGEPTSTAGPPGGPWRAAELDERAWRIPIPDAVIAELADAAGAGDLPATAGFALELRRRLLRGPGVLVAGRLPLERWPLPRRYAAVSALASGVGPLVDQTLRGKRLYDVHDTGAALRHGIRRSLTRLEQPFHTDGGWLEPPPHLVGLFCFAASWVGGGSRCLCLRGVHADLERDEPELCRRLFEPFAWDCQAEHPPGEPPFSRRPVFWREGGAVNARVYADYVRKGTALAHESLDAPGAAALDALEKRMSERDRWLELRLEPGEVLWLDNRRCAHARTAFHDGGGASSARHLVRTWSRFDGGAALEGQADMATGSIRGSQGGSAYQPWT